MGDVKVPLDMAYNTFIAHVDVFEYEWFEDVAFQGFDPEVTYRMLLKKAAELQKTVKQFAADMQKIVVFYVRRGTAFNRDDFTQRSKTADIAKKVIALMTEYGIKANLGNTVGPEVLSVARVVIVFAEIAGAVYNSGLQAPIVQEDGLPWAFSFPAGASLMTDSDWKNYGDKYLDMMVTFHKVINRRKEKKSDNNTAGVSGIPVDANDGVIRQYQKNIAEVARAAAFTKKHLTVKRKRMSDLTTLFITTKQSRLPPTEIYVNPNPLKIV